MDNLLKKEIIINWREMGGIIVPILFFIFFIFIFAFMFYPSTNGLEKVIWLAILFSTILKVERLLDVDNKDGSLEQYILQSPSLLSLVCIKVLAHWLVNILPFILLSPIIAIIVGIESAKIFLIFATAFIGSIALAFIAMLGSALTLSMPNSSMLLAILVLPLSLPLIIFAIAVIESANLNIFLLFCSSSLFLLGTSWLFSVILLKYRF